MLQKLSVIIPCYNEENDIGLLLEKVLSVTFDQPLEKELIVVNDASTDKTAEILKTVSVRYPSVSVINHPTNMGKGAAIRTALKRTTGDIVIIQDADQEYDPADYNKLLRPIFDNKADVVYGSRFKGDHPNRKLFPVHTIGNKLLTALSNLFTGFRLTDMETCYKVFKGDVIRQIHIKENRFGFEPEVTAKISRIKNVRVCEIPVSYQARTYAKGKKIKWTDGFRAVWCIFNYNLFSRKE